MNRYTVVFPEQVKKDIADLPKKIQNSLLKKVGLLEKDPRPHGAIKLSGNEDALYRLRAGDYRILYKIQDLVLLVIVIKIGHRREVYLKR